MKIRFFRISSTLLLLNALCFLGILLTACSSSFLTSSSSANNGSFTFPTNNGPITYSTNAGDVVVRTFYGGGNLGTLAFSPEISIFGDGTYILGPGYAMREGRLNADALQQLLHSLVDSDGLLSLTRQEFYDLPDQNATFLQLMLNKKHYQYVYGPFGALSESAQDIDEYHHMGNALTAISAALQGPTHSYSSRSMALLVHQDFSPDLTQNIPGWSLPAFSLQQLATYECGVIPVDQTGPNADTGCLTFTAPQYAYLPTLQQLQSIQTLLHGQFRGEFYEPASGFYYTVVLRPLLPDELSQKMLAMLGSSELSYMGVPLHTGTIPTPIATP